jgi:hypothetical protein
LVVMKLLLFSSLLNLNLELSSLSDACYSLWGALLVFKFPVVVGKKTRF